MNLFNKIFKKNKINILITGGGCEEKIDNVRSLCNFSTGKTATTLANYFARKSCNVTAIMSYKAIKPTKCNLIEYRSFVELKNALQAQLSNNHFDLVIHAAAVSDYSIDFITIDDIRFEPKDLCKIDSGKKVSITLKENEKLISNIKRWAFETSQKLTNLQRLKSSQDSENSQTTSKSQNSRNPTKSQVSIDFQVPQASIDSRLSQDLQNHLPILIGFKLTDNLDIENRKIAVKKIIDDCKKENKEFYCDYVVSNDKSEITKFIHPCTLYDKNLDKVFYTENIKDLASFIYKILLK